MGIFKKKEKDPLIKMDKPKITIDKNKSITITGTLITNEEKQKLIDSASSNSNISVTEVKSAEEQPAAEWIWVEGYKGTDKNMTCQNNFQFTLGETYTLEEPIEMCANGFHFSPTLKQAFTYYPAFGKSNRFFKVKALVNKNQMVTYTWTPYYSNAYRELQTYVKQMQLTDDKLVAKSIILLEEVSTDEIIKAQYGEDSSILNKSSKFKEDLRIRGFDYAQRAEYKEIINNLDCYSGTFKEYVKTLYDDKTIRKIALLGQEKINHETRMQMIFDNKYII